MILVECEAGDAAKCRDELILLANGFAQAIDFNIASLLRQLPGVSDPAMMRMKSLQKGRGKATGGPETGSRRNIRKGRDFYLRRLGMLQCQRFSNDGMFDIRYPIDVFQRGIFQIDARAERPHDCDIDILVDRGCEQESLMLAVVRSQIRTAAAQGDAQRATRDNHIRSPRRFLPPPQARRSRQATLPRARARRGCPPRTPPFPSPSNYRP